MQRHDVSDSRHLHRGRYCAGRARSAAKRTGRTWGMSDYQVGVIGLGHLGWLMAKNLLKAGGNILKAGHKLAVFDLDGTRVAKFVQEESNAVAADNAAALAKASNVIITMLPTGPIVRDVMQGLLADGALNPGT